MRSSTIAATTMYQIISQIVRLKQSSGVVLIETRLITYERSPIPKKHPAFPL